MLKRNLVDEVITLNNEEAINMTHRLWNEEGLFAGVSSGANVAVSMQQATNLKKGQKVVTILADSGNRYITEERFVT